MALAELNLPFMLPYSWLMMIMSMVRDYVSELRPSMGLLFIPQVIYEHREPWWNDIDRVKSSD
jgi:hypothetical protein